MRSIAAFIFGAIIGAAASAYITKSIAEKKAEDRIEQATIEARDYYKDKYAPKKEEPKSEAVINKEFTRIYGRQFDLYSEPEILGDRKEDPEAETHAYPIEEEEFGMDSGYTTYSVDYYSDGTMIDETGNVVDDPIHLVGGDVLDGLCVGNPTAYVRNDITKTDYEICFIDADYEPEVGVKD